MILSSQEIQNRCAGPQSLPHRLIDPFDLNSLRRSSYDLTVGSEYYCGDSENDRSLTLRTQNLPTSATFSIPAHGVCFILCAETITLPDNITARVALRMSLIYQGLVLTAQPPFDPGYSGKVIVMLHNLSSRPVHVTQGSRIATIEFSEVTHPTAQRSPHRSVSSLAGQLTVPLTGSLMEIDKQVKDANSKVNALFVQLGTIIALVLAVPAIAAYFSFSALNEKIADLKATIAKHEDLADSQRKQIDDLKERITQPTNPKGAVRTPAEGSTPRPKGGDL
jgi:deoxycytidine triphosphate deaminase